MRAARQAPKNTFQPMVASLSLVATSDTYSTVDQRKLVSLFLSYLNFLQKCAKTTSDLSPSLFLNKYFHFQKRK